MKSKLPLGEFLATFSLVYLSQTALSSFELIGTQNDILTRRLATILAYGLAYSSAVLMTLDLSGGHLNPAYTFACASFGHMRWGRAIGYMTAQYVGSFLAAIFLHATFSDKLAQRHNEGLLNGMNSTLKAHGNILSTGKFFSSYPPTEVSLTQLFISYTLATLMLTYLIEIVYKSTIIKVSHSLKPIYLAAAHCLIMATYSANGGPVFNPAQDFSPRLYIYLFGWGSAAFNLYHFKYWWLCGILAPHFGALIGMALYRVLEHLHKPHDVSYVEGVKSGTAVKHRQQSQSGLVQLSRQDSLTSHPPLHSHHYHTDYILPTPRIMANDNYG